jgi:hypothetical protein
MWFKILLNVLFNVGLFLCMVIIYYGFKNSNWAYVLGAVFAFAMILIFKLRLIKDIRNTSKKP